MRTGVAISVLALLLGFAGISAAKPAHKASGESSRSEQTQRHASTLRAKAQELRQQANHLRDGEESHGKPNVPKAHQLERKADALEAQANKLDAQGWPP
jgi:cell division protein FtsB